MTQEKRSENPNDFKYLEMGKILEKIQFGVKYCSNTYDYHTNRCTRIGKKYDCENCKIDEKEMKPICKAWKRVMELTRLYHICQIMKLILVGHEEKEIDQLPEWAKHQKKAEIEMPIFQLDLFRGK